MGEKGSVAKKDSIIKCLKSWTLDESYASQWEVVIDTAFHVFQNYHPVYKNDISATFVGNMGTAYQSNNFFKRKRKSDFYFYKNFENYVWFPEDVKYYNVTIPFTHLDYTQSENKNTKNETRFNVLHSQNVNEQLNFALDYRINRSQGQFQNQEAKNNMFNFSGSYIGDVYQLHCGIIINKLTMQENGGLENDSTINDTGKETEELPVRIYNGTRNLLQSTTFRLDHELRWGKYKEIDSLEVYVPRVGLQHRFELSMNKRSFSDDNADRGFYENHYIDELVTNDEVKFRNLENRFQLNAFEAPDRKFTFGKAVYLENELVKITIPDTLLGSSSETYTNTFIGGMLYRRDGKFWNWEGTGRIGITGHKKGAYDFSFNIEKSVRIARDTLAFKANIGFSDITPDYFQQNYVSNHYIWNNNFDHSQELKLNFQIELPAREFSAGLDYTLLGNYIYNNEQAMPAQATKEFSLLGFYVNSHIRWGLLHLNTKLLLQEISHDKYLRVPRFSAFASTYLYFKMAKVMHTQIGVDTRYFSKFYADAYDPATMNFHLQNERKIGGYPTFDLFVNLKLKRTRAFFKLINAGGGIIGKEQFSALHYPVNRRTFRVGIAWTFYD